MYGTDYSRWDNIKDSDDDATAPAPAPLPPQKPQSDQPLDPTNVAAMRELLHEIDDGRRPHLLAAIEWVEAARATLDGSASSLGALGAKSMSTLRMRASA